VRPKADAAPARRSRRRPRSSRTLATCLDSPPPSRHDQFRDFLIQLNDIAPGATSLMLRYDAERVWSLQPKPPGVTRILCLGDSCTYGTGVTRADAFPALLDQLLGPSVDVVNAGVPGYTSYQAVRYLESEGLALEPDIVLFTLGFNDRRSWGALTEADGARIVFMYWPQSYNLEQPESPRLTVYQQRMRRLAERDDHALINPIPALLPLTEPVHLFDKVHMTALGYATVAQVIAARLRELGWVPDQP